LGVGWQKSAGCAGSIEIVGEPGLFSIRGNCLHECLSPAYFFDRRPFLLRAFHLEIQGFADVAQFHRFNLMVPII